MIQRSGIVDPTPRTRVDVLGPKTTSPRLAWTLTRRPDLARCVLSTVGDRVELHITMTHEVVISQQCSTFGEAAAVSEAWWMALVNRGWVAEDGHIALRRKPDRRGAIRHPPPDAAARILQDGGLHRSESAVLTSAGPCSGGTATLPLVGAAQGMQSVSNAREHS